MKNSNNNNIILVMNSNINNIILVMNFNINNIILAINFNINNITQVIIHFGSNKLPLPLDFLVQINIGSPRWVGLGHGIPPTSQKDSPIQEGFASATAMPPS